MNLQAINVTAAACNVCTCRHTWGNRSAKPTQVFPGNLSLKQLDNKFWTSESVNQA